MLFFILTILISILLSYFVIYYRQKYLIRSIQKADPKKLLTYINKGGMWADLIQYIQSLQKESNQQSASLVVQKNNMIRLIGAVEEAVIILNNKAKLMHYNSKSNQLFNISGDKKSSYLNEIIRSPDVVNIFKQCLKLNHIINQECSFTTKNSYSHSTFYVMAVPLLDQDSIAVPTEVALLFYDRTKLKAAKKSHIDFVSNVSHELKTPLTAMQGFVEVLIQDFSKNKLDQFEQFLNRLLRNCKRIGYLVDDLLHLSNLSAKIHIEKEWLSTKEITDTVLENYKYPDHQLQLDFSAKKVLANRRWLEIILRNLIDNACRHTPKGGKVCVQWEEMDRQVLLKVRDDGEGVPEKYHQRIFERFFRMDYSRSRAKGGAGVGLALVKQAMERQGAYVRVESTQNKGAEFICEFPN